MFFTGVAYMIGAGIFTLMPYVIKYGKNAILGFYNRRDFMCFYRIKFFKIKLSISCDDAEYSWI